MTTERLIYMPRPPRKKKSLPVTLAMRSPRDYQLCAERLKALADPDRLRIVNRLLRGPKNVSQLAKELGESVVKVSHHLRVLRYAQVVEACKQGKFVIYHLRPEIVTCGETTSHTKTLDLGCCRLELAQSNSKTG